MEKIYVDHAATSFPKPKSVEEAMIQYIRNVGVNVNRGGYAQAYETAMQIYDTRSKLCNLFDFRGNEKQVIFSPNVTYALNFLIKGFLKKGDHVLVTDMEHNATMRPLVQLEKEGLISFSRIPCNLHGELLLKEIEYLRTPNTKAIFVNHGSNVCGTIQPLEKIGCIAKQYGLKFIVDSAQTAGVFPISMKNMHIDGLAFTGHKGLLGPQGIGGFLVREDMAKEMIPLITGGTGSMSDTEETPEFLPDKFEAGTMNIPGILGLSAGLDWIEQVGIEHIREKELHLTKIFLEGVADIEGLSVIGKRDTEERAAVVSLQCAQLDEATLAYELDSNYKISTRVGMHCAPNAHKTLGTFPKGTVRFSFGYYNTEKEISEILEALKSILNSYD